MTFAFSGFIEYQPRQPIPGLTVGDQFFGTYTFDPTTPRLPNPTGENTLDRAYPAITSWSVTLPGSGVSFSGHSGDIAVGNDTFYTLSDRYIATMYVDSANPPVVAGRPFYLFQIDLFDYGAMLGADMLNDSSLPSTPPDLSLVPDADQRGRFLLVDGNSWQNRTTSLTLVPEPSAMALWAGFGLVLMGARWGIRKRRRGD